MIDIKDIYSQGCYKSALKDKLQEKRHLISAKYTLGNMAKACGVQATYLSRVLNQEKPQLNEDQLYKASLYLGLSTDDQSYLQLMRSYQMCGVPNRKSELLKDINKIRTKNTRTERTLKGVFDAKNLEVDESYYLDPGYILVHACLAIPRFSETPLRLKDELNFPEQQILKILSALESWGLIAIGKDGVKLLVDALHLSRDSKLYRYYRQSQALAALEKIKSLEEEDSYNFSVTFSSDQETVERVRFEFKKFLAKIQKMAQASADNDAYQMNFDLFRWTKS